MPRKNRRNEPKPLGDFTPNEVVILHPVPRVELKSRAQNERERAELQREARMKNGIDWTICLVPGCGFLLSGYSEGRVPAEDRDPNLYLPMCHSHAAVVYRNMRLAWPTDDLVPVAVEVVEKNHEARHERMNRRSVEHEQGGPGAIYFLRQNGLVKVGWTSDLGKRLRAYGPDVDILCHYPGTRQDETTLHRQLRDHLAKGREWYHDDDVLAHFISEAIRRHGPPQVAASWTQPKPPKIRQRRRR